MFKKVLLSAMGLGAAMGAPIAYHSASNFWKANGGATSPAANAAAWQPGDPMPQTAAALGTQSPWETAPVHELGEVFRFDVTPGWVIHRWGRVSTGLAKPQLEGYRVPLVTGTSPADLAGALTYYFNSQQQLQEITFCGTTGDLRRLVELLMTRYNFTRRLTNDPALVVYEAVNPAQQSTGMLRVKPAQVVKASDANRRFVVELVIGRPEKS